GLRPGLRPGGPGDFGWCWSFGGVVDIGVLPRVREGEGSGRYRGSLVVTVIVLLVFVLVLALALLVLQFLVLVVEAALGLGDLGGQLGRPARLQQDLFLLTQVLAPQPEQRLVQ